MGTDTAWTVFRAGRQRPAAIAALQRRRLADLVTYARTHSAYYADRYRDIPAPGARSGPTDITRLPAITKPDAMTHFDDWVTDPAVRRAGVEAFLADPAQVGRDYLDRYVVCTTSGSTGTPAILLHDLRAVAVYNALGYVRALPPTLLRSDVIWPLVRGRGRLAAVFVTDGHFLGNTMMARRVRSKPWRRRMQRLLSALARIEDIVGELNAFQPVVLGGYPSALEALAREQRAGRLRIAPALVNAAGETLTDAARQRIGTAFACRVGNHYGTSEAVGLTYECSAAQLHVNSDWYILEPVDDHDQPVPPGRRSHGALVTNLANRIQPVIRYQIGDQIIVQPERCSCAGPFPVIEVSGRTDDTLVFATPAGDRIRVLPLAVATVAEETPGVAACQLVQHGPAALRVRFRTRPGVDAAQVWDVLRTRLSAYLAGLGALEVSVEKDDLPPQLHPRSGKFRQVYREHGTPRPFGPSPDARPGPRMKT
ncbi:phenylacetate--CoA ligase family protein [Mycolicibacterium duvalii]|uniref:Coenzyme F390 synthetase n=1 Tax=Mycolicibacterium duvalii TaxID=39688 RepID=A0A7I7K4P0_9MYCO|nr:phenylacetate--CoA ligase family protein [Mycolicibacterium duvalii]MCV7369053.1 phenylacetate--CoA ligase family protein [Mycolicibacterium duvalii]BBX19047.1 hypothetical protein MDUV_39070 [Mycolicibacterium duvalii]